MNPLNDNAPVSLQYDGFTAKKDRNRIWVLPGYWTGLLVGNILLAAVILLWNPEGDLGPPAKRWMFAAGPAMAGFSIELFLGTVFLGFSMWLKLKLAKEVRFSSFWKASIWGLFIPAAMPTIWSNVAPASWTTIMLILTLLLHVVYPVIAGQFLCYRSHLRD